MAVEMKPVTSSNIAAIGHDADTGTLHVQFKSGGTWTYPDPDGTHHKALQAAQSVGKYFHSTVKALTGSRLP